METGIRSVLADPTMSSPPTTTTTPVKPKDLPAWKDILFGSLAGTAGKIIEYPFDTIKVRLQSQPDHLPLRYTGPLDCLRQSLASEGIRGLYRGVSAPLAGAAAENASLFWSNEVAKGFLQKYVWGVETKKDLPYPALLVAAGAAGAFTATILTPIELVKCRMQVPLHSPLDPTLRPGVGVGLSSTTLSPLAVISDVFRRQGIRGFWRGHLGTFVRETGGTAAWFGGNEGMLLFFRHRIAAAQNMDPSASVAEIEVPLSAQLLSGAAAGVLYNFLFYPADTIKSKIQTGELSSHSGARQTFTAVGRELWRAHGLRGLYRGCGITVMRSAPSSALIFTIVQKLREAFP